MLSKREASQSSRCDFGYWLDIPTRFRDNDKFDHVNNAVYYSFMDTVVNEYLDRHRAKPAHIRNYAVNSQCQYLSPLSFPSVVQAGLAVTRIGHSSVTFSSVCSFIDLFFIFSDPVRMVGDPTEIGLFTKESDSPKAVGLFTEVFLSDDPTPKAQSMPSQLLSSLQALLKKEPSKL